MSEIADRIRVVAYQLWEAEGRPPGSEREHWARAEALVLAENAGASAQIGAAAAAAAVTEKAGAPAKVGSKVGAKEKVEAKLEARAAPKKRTKRP